MGMYAFLSKGDLIEMNNKKLSRLLEPNLKLYFLCMIVFAAATATVSLPLGLVEIACTVGLYAYFTNRNQKRRQQIHPHHLSAAHHGVPAGHRRGDLEQ